MLQYTFNCECNLVTDLHKFMKNILVVFNEILNPVSIEQLVGLLVGPQLLLQTNNLRGATITIKGPPTEMHAYPLQALLVLPHCSLFSLKPASHHQST